MGNASSSTTFNADYESGIYMPETSSRTRNEINSQYSVAEPRIKNFTLSRRDNHGTWSLHFSESFGPIPRIGQFNAFDDVHNISYIGYGCGYDGKLLNDVWMLNIDELKWKHIKLTGEIKVSPRTDASAVLVENFLYVFGGYDENVFLDQLHQINIENGCVKFIQTCGDSPSPRSHPIFAYFNNSFFIWGGFNGQLPNNLHILDTQTLLWESLPQDVIGRKSAAWTILNEKIYSYGGSKSGGMLIIDMIQKKVSVEVTIGANPPSRVANAGMTSFDRFLFFYGGTDPTHHTFLYGCDTNQMWWFVLHVLPDGETTSLSDGVVCRLGLFMLPRISSFVFNFNKKKRELVAFLGLPINEALPISLINITDPISVLNLREDMYHAFMFDTGLQLKLE
ncbi:Kelch motif family protein [Tritrichomonas foetus]|uniref:Kelch motif family protein n=1 Tax=Tritrichomonas foetus TaxID=1144522 RepID=A0A1J4KRX1_9EUKA|nr:Kelch motif family protein [Tritrichomonas foetus]|eukprot:OHT14023.1 Kelch motif family protein [Tritrichomonas foetus]